MGILANHLATIQQLKPGVVEVVENPTTTKKFFGNSELRGRGGGLACEIGNTGEETM